ncbi:MAG: ribonuclease P protein component [Parcubacteria group bacterium]|nr:ribonuclease P protein component [Parcubacteria group bacterium]
MKFQGKVLVAYYEPGLSPARNKAIIVVGVKISKKAVLRNRIRRQIREIIRNYKKAGNFLAGGLKIVVLPAVLGSKFSDIKRELEGILIKIQ